MSGAVIDRRLEALAQDLEKGGVSIP